MNVQDLRAQLLNCKGGLFEMPAGALGWVSADALWKQCLASASLSVTSATPDADALSVRGNIALSAPAGSSASLPALVEFLSEDNKIVSGVRITAQADNLKIQTSFAKLDLSQERFLSFAFAGLQMSASTTQANQALIGFNIRTAHAKGAPGLWFWQAPMTAERLANPFVDPLQVVFAADLSSGLDAQTLDGLADFAPNIAFSKSFPISVLQGQKLAQVKRAEYCSLIADNGSLSWISSTFVAQLADHFPVVPGQIEADFIDAEIFVVDPAGSPTAEFALFGEFDFGDAGSQKDGAPAVKTELMIQWDPDLLDQGGGMPVMFFANAVMSVDLASIFRRFFKTDDLGPLDGLALTSASIQGNLSARQFQLSVALGRVDGQPFHLVGPLSLDQIGLLISYDGVAKSWSAALDASLEIAGERLAVNVFYDGAEWQLNACLDQADPAAGAGAGFFDAFSSAFNAGAPLPADVHSVAVQQLSLSGTLNNAKKSGSFSVQFIGAVPFCGNQVGISVFALLVWNPPKGNGQGAFSCSFTGKLALPDAAGVSGEVLEIDYSDGSFKGVWSSASASGMKLFDAAGAWFGFEPLPPLVPNPILRSFTVFHDSAKGSGLMVELGGAGNLSLGLARWSAKSPALAAGPAPAIAILGMDLGLTYSQTPLASSAAPANENFGLPGAQIVYANAAVGATGGPSIQDLFSLIPAGGPSAPDTSVLAGVSLLPQITPAGLAGGPFALNSGAPAEAAVWEILDAEPQRRGGRGIQRSKSNAQNAPLGDSGQGVFVWMPVNRSLGPVSINRLGVGFGPGDNGPMVSLGVDAGFSVSGLTLDFIGLKLWHDFKADADFKVSLDGVAVSLNDGAIAFSGEFIKTVDAQKNTEYIGSATLLAADFELAAEGAYSKTSDGDASFFVFGMLDEPIGGAPWCFVTGLAGAMGLHRSLKLPSLADLPTFPLVAAAIAASPSANPFSGSSTPAANLAILEPSIPVDYGSKWFGMGIRFSTFGILESFALFTACFGQKTQFSLLGLTAMTLPKGSPEPIAYAELAVEATLDPGAGVLLVEGALTPQSYVIDPKCQLQGGFAFCAWFKDQGAGQASAGEFVFSLGGYHPSFKVPSYYPTPARVSAHWPVNDCLNIDGSFYFALTPGALMAGGAMSAVWESDGVRAWFSESADFFLGWRPFHYEAGLDVSLGVSYTLDLWLFSVTVSVSLDVGVKLAGPPLHGEIDVDLYVVSFTISFGDTDHSETQPISWGDFKASLLPTGVPPAPARLSSGDPAPILTETLCRVRAKGGLAKDFTSSSSKKPPRRWAEAGGVDPAWDPQWILSPHGFELATESVFVSTALSAGLAAQPARGASLPTNIQAGPCGTVSYESTHAISLVDDQGADYSSALVVAAATQSVPRATWDAGAALNPNIDTLNKTGTVIPGALIGSTITPQINAPDLLPPVRMAVLGYSKDPQPLSFHGSSGFVSPANGFDQNQAQQLFDSSVGNASLDFLNQVIALAQKDGSNVASLDKAPGNDLAADGYLLDLPTLAPTGDDQ